MKVFILILSIFFCSGCKVPLKLTDHSTIKNHIDSNSINKIREQDRTDFLRALQTATLTEVNIKYYALLPNNLRSDTVVTYLVKEEKYKKESSKNLEESNKGEKIVEKIDSSGIKGVFEEQKDVVIKEKRRGMTVEYAILILLVILIGIFYIRRKFNF